MEKNKTIVFTIVSLNYLKYAKILGNSLIKHNPNFEFIILLVDEPKDHIKFEEEKFEIITLNKINIKNIKEFTFKYDITELNTAVKPLFFEYLMKKKNPKHLIYLDPDICVYNKFDKILKKLKENNVVLTPHFTSAIGDDRKLPSEISIMQVGCYNLGFIAMRNNKDTLRLVRWWGERLNKYCINMPEKGLFTDQKWMDLCPCLIDKVCILRDKGHNVAYWNLHERSNFIKKNKNYYVEGKPLIFFHFSGMPLDNLNKISKFQNRFKLSVFNNIVKELFEGYRKKVMQENQFKDAKYAYDEFNNGVRINNIIRKVYYNQNNKRRFGNPFETKHKGSFYRWLSLYVNKKKKITNLMYQIYKMRNDLQIDFANIDSNNEILNTWAEIAFKEDYNFCDRLYKDQMKRRKKSNLKTKESIYVYLTRIRNNNSIRKIARNILGEKGYAIAKEKYHSTRRSLLRK